MSTKQGQLQLSLNPLTVSNDGLNLFKADPAAVEAKRMTYAMSLTADDGRKLFFHGIKQIHDDPGFDLWRDTTTLAVVIREGPHASGQRLTRGRSRPPSAN